MQTNPGGIEDEWNRPAPFLGVPSLNPNVMVKIDTPLSGNFLAPKTGRSGIAKN